MGNQIWGWFPGYLGELDSDKYDMVLVEPQGVEEGD